MTQIVFFGSDSFSASILSCLLAHQHALDISISTIITQPPRPQGRGLRELPSPIALLAEEYGIPAETCSNRRDLDLIFEASKDVVYDAAILASFGIIVSQYVIDRFPRSIINVHPSLLPRWRGASPIQSAILHGDDTTGVSLMRLVQAMDAGPIYAQSSIPLSPQMTHIELQDLLAQKACALLRSDLCSILDGTCTPSPQDETLVTTCSKITKNEGALDPFTHSAIEIDRRVRALWPWPKTWLTWIAPTGEKVPLRIESGHPIPTKKIPPGSILLEQGELYIGTIEGSYVPEKIGRPGRPTLDAVSFARGFSITHGSISSPSL